MPTEDSGVVVDRTEIPTSPTEAVVEMASTVAAMDARFGAHHPLLCSTIRLEATCMLDQWCAAADARPTNTTDSKPM